MLFWSLWWLVRVLLFTLLFPGFFILADAVLFDELMQSWKIPEHMDSSATIQMSGLQKPEVVSVEMTHWTRKFGRGALLEIKRLEFRCLLVRAIFSVSFIERRYPELVVFLFGLFE